VIHGGGGLFLGYKARKGWVKDNSSRFPSKVSCCMHGKLEGEGVGGLDGETQVISLSTGQQGSELLAEGLCVIRGEKGDHLPVK